MHDSYQGVDPTATKTAIDTLSVGEQKLTEIRRHPFGIIILYIQATFALLLSTLLIVFLLPSVTETLGLSSGATNAIVGLFGLIALVLVVLFLLIATWIYNRSLLIVTTRNVTLINQIGLFNRKVSEIAMTNIEDVTSHKEGIFPTIFNFGVLKIETAGEQNNFTYTYCVNPNVAAKLILDARESFLMQHKSE
ncbi:MAG: PH domain-containing protein [Patescibacteria group bacterium]